MQQPGDAEGWGGVSASPPEESASEDVSHAAGDLRVAPDEFAAISAAAILLPNRRSATMEDHRRRLLGKYHTLATVRERAREAGAVQLEASREARAKKMQELRSKLDLQAELGDGRVHA